MLVMDPFQDSDFGIFQTLENRKLIQCVIKSDKVN